MVRAEVTTCENMENGQIEFDVEVFGSDSENTSSALIYCQDEKAANEVTDLINKAIEEAGSRIVQCDEGCVKCGKCEIN